MLNSDTPALALAPMDGITDAAMRALQGSLGAFTYSVSEFIRVSSEPIPLKVFRREVPELCSGAKTVSGLPVHVQLLGGDAERMASSASTACKAGATVIDINFGCPAPTVNKHDGGASLLRSPCRVRDVVAAVRAAVPREIPVSAKLRLGWDSIETIHETAAMAAEGGASWLTIHARTRVQGYTPPVYWPSIGAVRTALSLPVVANGDIWNFEDFLRCREETGCNHFMIGRGALANPALPHQIARALGLRTGPVPPTDWASLFGKLVEFIGDGGEKGPQRTLCQLKQWMKIAHRHGEFPHFDLVKQSQSLAELFDGLASAEELARAIA